MTGEADRLLPAGTGAGDRGTVLTVVPPRTAGLRGLLPGLGCALALAAVATALGHLWPLVGAPVIGIVLGVLLSSRLGGREGIVPGTRAAGRTVLHVAVVLLGAQLSLAQVAAVGASSLPVMLGTLAACLLVAALLGRRLGVDRDTGTLIGVGTAICGASAIAAVSPVIRARPPAIAYAISTIFLCNVAAVLLFPPLGHLLGMGQQAFGLFAGTAVNDTSSVVAAAGAYGPVAADHAVVVKLTRTLMIIPVSIGLAALTRRDLGATRAARAARLVPWFLVGFVLVATANSLGLVPAHAALRTLTLFLITTALAGIGLGTDLAGLRRAGARPLLLGVLLWVTVTVTSLALQTV